MSGILDEFANLPGQLTEYKDGGMQLVKNNADPETESIILLGTSTDGPVMQPVRVDADTYELFGKCTNENGVPNGATLIKAFEEAYSGGCRDIRLMRVTGKEAEYVLEGATSKKVKDKIFESLIGVAKGNIKSKSSFYLQYPVKNIVEVQANGIILSSDQYTLTNKVDVKSKYIDKNGKLYDEKDCQAKFAIKDSNVLAETATDDIYENNKTKEKVFGTSIVGDKSGYTRLTQKGIDYVKVVGSTAEEKYIDNKKDRIGSVICNSENEILSKVTRSLIEIKDNVTDCDAFIVIKYEAENGTIPVENASDISGTFIARGEEQTFDIKNKEEDIVPVPDMTKIYLNGVEYINSDKIEDSEKPIFEIITSEVKSVKKSQIKLYPGKHLKRGSKVEIRCLYHKETSYVPRLLLRTSFGGGLYNETQVQVCSESNNGVLEKIVKITKPRIKRTKQSEEPLTYNSTDYQTFGLLARAINQDARNAGFVKAIVSTDEETTPTVILNAIPVAKNFTGGDDGVNVTKQQLFEALSGKKDSQGYLLEPGAYQLLENYKADYVIPCGVCADDELVGKFDNFAYELALYCAVVSHRNHTTFGFIATSSPADSTLREIEKHVKNMEEYNNTYLMRDIKGEVITDKDKKPIDIGKFITVCDTGDPILTNTRLGQYAENSAVAVAGFISTLQVNNAPTNKTVPFTHALKIAYSNSQLNRLTAKNILSLKYKDDKGHVAIVDGMTAALSTSDYARISSFRAVRQIVNELREVADPFLGNPNTPAQRNALSSLIDKRLGLHKEAGTIKDYSFNVVASALDELMGQAKIELTLVPAQELREITTIVSLKPSI